jgi:hypothetical protein
MEMRTMTTPPAVARPVLLVVALLAVALTTVGAGAQQTAREEQCLRTARLVGALGGSTVGLITLYAGTFLDDIEGPYWKTLAIGVPTTVVGVWVGIRGTEWATRKLLAGRDKVPGAAGRGLLYGLLDGALIGSASFVTALTIGHLTGGIEFNDDPGLLEVMGMGLLGGVLFGGLDGATVGVVCGPCISLYMDF